MEPSTTDAAPAVHVPDTASELRGAGQVLTDVTRRLEHSEGTTGGTRAEWAQLVAESQRVVNTATALQNLAITRLAAIEDDLLDDGSVVESARVPGHIALDAPDVVAGALGVSHNHAEQRVSLAVRLTVPDDDDAGLGAGLGGLHAAMADGVLDAYRASVVADELAEAPPEVAAAVVHVLVPYLGLEPPAALRSRCRRAISRISPDLLVQRAKAARERCGLRRWAQEPGVDRWEGTFPSERAAEGWAAVDGLAQRYVAQGRCATVEAARGEALMDLIRGQATIDVQLVVTVPAEVVDVNGDGDGARAETQPDDPLRGDAYGDGARAEAQPDSPLHDDGDGAPVTRSPDVVGRVGTATGGNDESHGVIDIVGGQDDLVEVTGPFPGGPVLVSRRWVTSLVRSARRPPNDQHEPPTARPPNDQGEQPTAEPPNDELEQPTAEPPKDQGEWPRIEPNVHLRVELCHAHTGALLGAGVPGSRGYRPGRRVAALVRARDGRCRFPGCSVAARFCDLDHVRPWPGGPTAPENLMCLCRRHHRIKQRLNWWVRLLPDGRAVWTDPTGRVRTSWPRDLLTAVVLSGSVTSPLLSERPASGGPEGVERPNISTWSIWETLLEVRVEHLPGAAGALLTPCRGGPVPTASARGRPGPSLCWPARGRFHYADDRRAHVRLPSRAPRSSSVRSTGDVDKPPF